MMVAAGMNDLAMRFGGWHLHRFGNALELMLLGMVAVGVLIWALSHSERNQSAGR
jgi:hypothetical protein